MKRNRWENQTPLILSVNRKCKKCSSSPINRYSFEDKYLGEVEISYACNKCGYLDED